MIYRIEATNKKEWLDDNFLKWKEKYKIRAFSCYGGDVRLYDGTYMEISNSKQTFRRTSPDKNEKGNIIGWHGLRGVFKTKYVNYISIEKDEFSKIKEIFNNPKSEEYAFYNDLIFEKLCPENQS